ncbi:MAG: phosphoribosylanthranilate isomerase [Defluviitaleaceae bacterium]|nr:phosphoribosylanthranilate isomerase [Defluviitaleaceae bacterium]
MTNIKICGLNRLADIEMVNKLLPEYVGFVFAKSRRQVDAVTAQTLKNRLDPTIVAVGVFVEAAIDDIVKLVETHVIDMVQLHGDEDERYISQLRQKVSVPIIKAVAVTGRDDVHKAGQLAVDYLLFDGQQAGSGQTFDWQYLSEVKTPYFLAGGLCEANVAQALLKQPFAVDVSSGVETKGVKDEAKIRTFIERIRKQKEC